MVSLVLLAGLCCMHPSAFVFIAMDRIEYLPVVFTWREHETKRKMMRV